ncbi:MAG: type II toxin-antitoxin system RelE/ParE family toxin [bacterium]
MDILALKRIGRKVVALEPDPLGTSKKLVSAALGTYRFRIGDYRVIFDLHGRDVVILRIGHPREICR